MNFNKDWQEVKLGEIIESVSKTHSFEKDEIILINTSDVLDGKVLNHKYVKNENIKGQFKKTFKKNDILYSEIRPKNRRFAYVDFNANDYVASTKLMVLRKTSNLVENKFLFYLITSNKIIDKLQNLAETRSGTFPQITFSEVANLKIKLPTFKEQRKIANFISSLDKKIENNNKMNKNLEEMAQAIYKNWFVDFEPFQNKEFVESELGMIPEGWEVGHLGDKKLTNLIRGSINKFKGEKIYLATADVNNKKIDNYNTIITYNDKPSRANRKPEPNTIWFAKMRDSKKLILVSEYNKFLINNIILSTGFMGLDVKEYALYYVWNFINNKNFEEKKDKLCTGTTMEAINMTNTKKLKLLIPSKEVLNEFNSLMEPIYKKINSNKAESRNLKELRYSLLPKLMSGEVKVPLEDEKEVR